MDVRLNKLKKLEKEHVEIYYNLLQSLDELYLLKEQSSDVELDNNNRFLMEIRTQLQMSMDKSVAMLKAFERLNNQKNNIINEEDLQSTPAEDILAKRMQALMDENFNLDSKINTTLERYVTESTKLRESRSRYHELTKTLQSLHSEIKQQTNQQNADDSYSSTNINEEDNKMEEENEIISQLLIALKVHTNTL